MTVKVGQRAPDFDLESDHGGRVSLSDFDGKWLALYFYPRDNTPGCALEAQGFTASAERAKELGAAIAGVSRDSVKSHGSFRAKYGINFPLLSDPDLRAHMAYGAWGKKTMYGREVEGTIRSTFLVAPDGKIARVWSGVRVNGHPEAVFAAIAEATGAPSHAVLAEKTAPGKVASVRAAPAAKKKAVTAPETTAKKVAMKVAKS